MTSIQAGPGRRTGGVDDDRPRRLGVARWFDGRRMHDGDVEVSGGRVSAVGLAPGRSGIAAPGYLDLQVNGFRGVDGLSADADALVEMARQLATTGVTGFLLTLISAPPAQVDAALARVAAVTTESSTGGARLLGAHLEGPFLSPDHPGAHALDQLRDPDPVLLDRWLATGVVRMVTLAPELPGATALIRAARNAGVVVSLGHTAATAAAADAAYDAGATALTHAFNAHRPLRAREPGPLGVALTRTDVVLTAIVDGLHLAPQVVDLLALAAPGRVALVTDAMVAAGMGDGMFRYGPLTVEVTAGRATTPEGRLAGSVATFDHVVRVAAARWGVEAALAAATRVPARLLGDGELGRLRAGGVADLVVLDDDLQVRVTLGAGRPLCR